MRLRWNEASRTTSPQNAGVRDKRSTKPGIGWWTAGLRMFKTPDSLGSPKLAGAAAGHLVTGEPGRLDDLISKVRDSVAGAGVASWCAAR